MYKSDDWKNYIESLSEEHQSKLLAAADIALFDTNWDIEDKRLAQILSVFVENIHKAIEEVNPKLLNQMPEHIVDANFTETGTLLRQALLLMNTVKRETETFPMGDRYYSEAQRGLRKAAYNALQAQTQLA